MLSKLERTAWRENLLAALTDLGDVGSDAAEYLRLKNTYIGFLKVRKNVGAFWTVLRTIHFNSIHYSHETDVADIGMMTLLIHEVRHLQQGWALALSVYGELEAWQLQFHWYYRLTGKQPHPAIAELMALPLEYDRDLLRKAAKLMKDYAGKGYRIDLLPIYPWGREIRYWLTGR